MRQHYKNGADLIKIMPSGGVLDESASADNAQLTIAEIQAVVAAAHDYGFTVAAHAHGAEAIRRAVIGGVDSIEHGTFMDDDDMKLMKEHGTWYVPTIIAGKYVEEKANIPGYYPAQVAVEGQAGRPDHPGDGRASAYKAGVKIAFGTDAAVYPHGQNAKEFQYMVEAGMPPMFALQAATTHAAQLLKHDKGSRQHRRRQVRRRRRRARQSARRHHADAESRIRDEGRRRLQGERQAGDAGGDRRRIRRLQIAQGEELLGY